MSIDTYSFGELLTTLRKQRRMSQNDLAEKLDVHRNTIGKWERGIGLPDSKTLVLELARQLRLDEQEIRQLLEASLTAVSPYWNVPHRRNPFFTGRSTVLEHLHTMMTHEPTIAALTQSYGLHGLGGIGKTQLAIEYAYQHRYDYDATLWVEAETLATLVASFMNLATLLRLPEKTAGDQSKIVAAVLRWLNQHKGWLLIFDNVEDLSLIKPFLPASDQGALLLTTRLQSLGTLAQRVELPLMTMQEGCDFLLARTHRLCQSKQGALINPPEILVAQQIIAEMGGLPLALEQAGAYIEATQCSLSDYLHLFRTAQPRLLDEHEPSSDHPLSVSRTFALAFERVEQRNRLAAELLVACTFLAPDTIPEMFFLEGASLLGPTFEALATDPLAFSEAIKLLLSYSLIQRNAATQTITIHRLVQVVLKGRLTEAAQHMWMQRLIKAMSQLFPADERIHVDYLSVCEQLLPHAQMCLLFNDKWSKDETLRLHLMGHIAIYFFERARHTEAEQLFERTLQMGELALGLEHPLVAEALQGLADIYQTRGQYAEAKPLLERAIRIREHMLGMEHPLVARSCERLGSLYWQQGKYEQAEPLYQRSLRILEQAMGPDHSLVAYALLGLSGVYALQGKYEQAESFYQRTLHIWERTLGPESIRVAFTLNNLGTLYGNQEKYEQAEPFYQRALHIWEQALGPDHPNVTTVLNNLGSIYADQGKYELAEPLYLRVLHSREYAVGPDHIRVSDPLNGLANLYRDQGQYEQAKPFYQRALALRQQHLGPDHPDIAETLYDLARFHHLQLQTTEALSLYQQALAIHKKVFGQEHPTTQKTCRALTLLLQEIK